MKNTLKLEQLGLFFLALWFFRSLDIAWWWYAVLFLAPDVSFLAYVAGTRAGAWVYNVLHHQGVAVLVYLIGLWQQMEWVSFAGLLMLGHSAFDRVAGYGLKYPDHFKHTHLGWIGGEKAGEEQVSG